MKFLNEAQIQIGSRQLNGPNVIVNYSIDEHPMSCEIPAVTRKEKVFVLQTEDGTQLHEKTWRSFESAKRFLDKKIPNSWKLGIRIGSKTIEVYDMPTLDDTQMRLLDALGITSYSDETYDDRGYRDSYYDGGVDPYFSSLRGRA